MGLRINTNIASINAQRHSALRTAAVNRSLEKLSSGERINKAADDAAGLGISEKFKAAIRGFKQASRSAMDGISMIQTGEGGLNEIGNILTRLRELSVQAASDTIGKTERGFLQMEYKNLTDEIQRISLATEFNGVQLLQGKAGANQDGPLEFQIGIKNRRLIDRLEFDPKNADARYEAIGLQGTGVGEKKTAQGSIGSIDLAITSVSKMRARFGALQNRLQSTVNNLAVTTENMEAAKSRIRDTDVAVTASELARDTILAQASAAMLAQANQQGRVALQLIRA